MNLNSSPHSSKNSQDHSSAISSPAKDGHAEESTSIIDPSGRADDGARDGEVKKINPSIRSQNKTSIAPRLRPEESKEHS